MQSSTNTATELAMPFARPPFRRDIGRFFSSLHPLMLFAALVVLYTFIIWLGAYLGQQRLRSGLVKPESSMQMAVASVLGLLTFIQGFTFSLTWSRFTMRNSLVIAHAKAIGVCYLRAGLVPGKQKGEIRSILREYEAIIQTIQKAPELAGALAKVNELHHLLWQQTMSLSKEDMDSELRSLVVMSVNDLIGLSLERKIMALFIRIPNAIWISLLFLAIVGMFSFGYHTGVSGGPKLFQLTLLPVAFSLVMLLISDLNSPEKQRHFKISSQPLQEIREMMAKENA